MMLMEYHGKNTAPMNYSKRTNMAEVELLRLQHLGHLEHGSTGQFALTVSEGRHYRGQTIPRKT